jgi:PAS domain-containing protein
MLETMSLVAWAGGISILTVFAGLYILTVFQNSIDADKQASIFREGKDATIFLFDGEDLVDATPSANRLLTGSAFPDKPWFALLERLSSRFENLEERLSEVELSGSIVLPGLERPGAPLLSLRAESRGGLLKIALVAPARETGPYYGDVLTVQALDSELQDLRDASNVAPFPMWRVLANGETIWANAAYMELLPFVPKADETPEWPLRPIFDLAHQKGDIKNTPLRRHGPLDTGWFDVLKCKAGDDQLFYAVPANSAVAAEGALQDFKKTLTNTFAELSTGLAVFDHNRKLQLFNPALAKLIDVPVEHLLKRPALFALLDSMRDKNMLPEPKDYKSWRHQMVDIEATSIRGQYNETWHLSNGKAFRVVGRPYPNGALALMIDDITDQITRDRLFRDELDLAMAIVNNMDEAVVVFAATGEATFANRAYRSLWNHDPVVISQKGGPLGVLEMWRRQTDPSLVWTEIEALLSSNTSPTEGFRMIRMTDGRMFEFRILNLQPGSLSFAFRPIDHAAGRLSSAPTETDQLVAWSA